MMKFIITISEEAVENFQSMAPGEPITGLEKHHIAMHIQDELLASMDRYTDQSRGCPEQDFRFFIFHNVEVKIFKNNNR